MRRFKSLAIAACAAALLVTAATPARAQQGDQEEIYKLANMVRKQIIMLDNYGVFDNITFGLGNATTGYKVVLKGQASRPTLKDSAERVVKKIELVESVDNQIEVLPLSNVDDQIRTAVYAKIYYHPSLSRYNPNRGVPMYGFHQRAAFGISNDPPMGYHPMHIIVKNGNVTLEGVVDTEGDKTIAGMQANSVGGVFSVTNNLEVLQKPKKKDDKK